jgi:hypothetical protein
MDNLFIESPVHRAQLFDALDRAAKRVDESSQGTLTALPTASAPPIAPNTVTPLGEAPRALSNAGALAGVAAPGARRERVEVRFWR